MAGTGTTTAAAERLVAALGDRRRYAVVAPDGRIADASPSLTQLLFDAGESPVGLPLASMALGDEAARLAEWLAAARHAGGETRERFRLRRCDGRQVVLDLVALPFVAEYEQPARLLLRFEPVRNDLAEDAGRDDGIRHAAIMSALEHGVIVHDRSGAVCDCNGAAERILGRAAGSLAEPGDGGPGWGAIAEDGSPLPLESYPPLVALASGRKAQAAMAIRRPDGNIIWASITSVPLGRDENGTPTAVVSSISDITLLREREKQLEHIQGHDHLTGLPNRDEFFRVARRAFAEKGRKPSLRDAVLHLDLDDYKRVNDMFGHGTGDELLAQAAARVRQCIRPGDVAARLAGDEFAMLLLDVGSVWNAVRVAQRVLDAFSEPFRLDGVALDVTASIGIAVAAESAADPAVVVNQADIALRRAKAGGKARYVVYDAHLDARVKDNLEIEADLRQALGRHEFEVHYQPLIELQSGTVAGAETLLRWRHPKRDLVPPAEFIPVAEDNGTIHPIGEWVLEQSLTQLKAWLERHPGLHLGINLSPKQLESPQFLTTFARILGVSGVPHDAVMLELTETYLMQDVERAARDLRRFASLGVQIAIDDFGTGYSSLKYLQHLPITHLKIDRSFINRIMRDDRSRVLVEAILLLADKLELKVIAEGVETREQAEFLVETGCRWAQGYLFERPMTAADFDSYLAPKLVTPPATRGA